MQEIYAVVSNEFQAVNDTIIKQLHSGVGLVEDIGHYIVEAGGKRLRPLVVLLSAQACGYKGTQHVDLATIIEFIHTATLLHDDVVDVSDMRRGRFTANAKYGNAPSVLVGDFLYSRAFQMMVTLQNMRIMDILSSATNTIAEGEVLQLINAGDPTVSEQQYFDVIKYKTATLFEAATHTGAILAEATPVHEEALRQYGLNLGIAFQLIDDVLDYQGDPQKLGKNVGDDLAEGKPTLPLIYAIKNSSAAQAEIIRQGILNKDLNRLKEILEIVQNSGAIAYTLEQARKISAQAISNLTHLQESAEKSALIRLANLAVDRSF